MAENVYIWGNFKSILMMNTATNNEFYERQSIEEFLGEHEVVKELYEVVKRSPSLFSLGNNGYLSEEQLLQVFNAAYYICMRLTDGSDCSLREVWNEELLRMANFSGIFQYVDFALARSLLLVHKKGIITFDKRNCQILKRVVSEHFDWSGYDTVVNKYCGTLTQPLDFSGLSRKAPAVQQEEVTDPMQLLERAASDVAKAKERMQAQLAAKDEYIKELTDQVREEQTKVQAKEGRIKELEGRNASLSQNPFCLGKIKDYAKGLDKEEAKVITHMLLTIAPDEQLAEVRKAVKEVDEVHKKQVLPYVHIERQEIHNDNKDSQVFNGPIDNSKFGK